MGKKATKPSEKPTSKSVLKYAAELRDAAERARIKDPNVERYAPSDDVARKVIQAQTAKVGKEDAPGAALVELARRAAQRDINLREESDRASQGRRRHREHQLKGLGEREAAVAVRSLGQRLDDALRGLVVVSEAPAARLDGDRVTGGSYTGDHLARLVDRPRSRRVLERDLVFEDARRLVERAERLLESARRMRVEEVSAA